MELGNSTPMLISTEEYNGPWKVYQRHQGSGILRMNQIHVAARQRILFLPHAMHQMARPDRTITGPELRRVLFDGEIIESCP